MAAALATQRRDPEHTYYMDPFLMTRMLVKDEFRPALPPGVSKAWTVAAYPSAEAFRRDVSTSDVDRKTQVALLLSHRFLTPIQSDPKHDMLKRAVDLAMTDAFRRKRSRSTSGRRRLFKRRSAMRRRSRNSSSVYWTTTKPHGKRLAKSSQSMLSR